MTTNLLADLGTDAAKWAVALAERLGSLGNDALDASPGGDLFGWCANMIEAGRSAGYAEAENAVISIADVNAVEIDIDDGRNVSLKIDGVGRMLLGNADRVIIRDPFGNRYVVLRDGEPIEAVPNTGREIDQAIERATRDGETSSSD